MRETIEQREMRGKKHEGAQVVVRAWLDPAFKTKLFNDGNAAVKELLDMDLDVKLVALVTTTSLN